MTATRVAAGQRGERAVVDAHVAIGVINAEAGVVAVDGLRRHPFPGELAAPGRGCAGRLAQWPQFLAQGAHLRYPFKPYELAPLARRLVAQILDATHPQQRHEREHEENRLQRIEAFREGEELAAVAQPPLAQQGRQRPQDAALWHVVGALELHRRRAQEAERGEQPLTEVFCPEMKVWGVDIVNLLLEIAATPLLFRFACVGTVFARRHICFVPTCIPRLQVCVSGAAYITH